MPARILETHRQLFSDLPAVPKILHRLRSMLADPEIPLEAVGARIAADQALAEGFLSMRRLPFFGTVSALDRVEECVLVLGRDKTRTLLGILEAYRLVETSDQDVLQLKSLVWRHGLGSDPQGGRGMGHKMSLENEIGLSGPPGGRGLSPGVPAGSRELPWRKKHVFLDFVSSFCPTKGFASHM